MIEAQALSRRYGDFTAVHDVSFAVDEGEIVGILGPNGAGKTTTIRMLTGFLPPSSGAVTVDGIDLLSQPLEARRRIGYLPENVALYTEMRVHEYLSYRASLTGMSRDQRRGAIGEALERCLLEDVEHQIIGTLSKGYRQRVGLAAAILHKPAVLVLDEPTVGLDPKQIVAIRELIRELGESRTLMVSTHILSEVEQLCGRVLIIDRGRIVAEGSPQELRDSFEGETRLQLTLLEPVADAVEPWLQVEGIESVQQDRQRPERLTLRCAPGTDPRADVFRFAVARGWVLLELAEHKASLEDIFVRLTHQGPADDDAPEDSDSDGVGPNAGDVGQHADDVGPTDTSEEAVS